MAHPTTPVDDGGRLEVTIWARTEDEAVRIADDLGLDFDGELRLLDIPSNAAKLPFTFDVIAEGYRCLNGPSVDLDAAGIATD